MKRFYLVFVFIFGLCGLSFAQSEPHRVTQLERRVSTLEGKTQRVSGLEHRISTLENKIRQAGDQGLVLILFGTFCALWAQNTERSAWLWFILGLFFSIIVVFVLLAKNSGDIDRRRRSPAPNG